MAPHTRDPRPSTTVPTSPSTLGTGRASRKKRKITPRFWMVAALLFALYMAVSYVSGYIQITRINGEIRRIEARMMEVEARNEALREELEYLQSDEYVEKTAREQLGLVKPGETAIRVMPNP